MNEKAISFRLPKELEATLGTVARAKGIKLSEAVREAIKEHIAARRTDEDFQRRLKELLEEDRELLEGLAGED